MLVIGMGALTRADGAAIAAAGHAIAKATGMISGDWNGFNVLHSAAGRVGALDVGFVPGEVVRRLRVFLMVLLRAALKLSICWQRMKLIRLN